MHLVGPEDLAVLDLWAAWRGGELGAGPLPFAGGQLDQPACVMAALRICAAAYRAVKPKEG